MQWLTNVEIQEWVARNGSPEWLRSGWMNRAYVQLSAGLGFTGVFFCFASEFLRRAVRLVGQDRD